jgi:hypothetical protein
LLLLLLLALLLPALLLLALLLLLAVLLLSTWLLQAHTQSRSTTRAAADTLVADQQDNSNIASTESRRFRHTCGCM